MKEIRQVRPTEENFEVRRVANGLMVISNRRPEFGMVGRDCDIHVFGDMKSLANWLLAEESGLSS